MSLIVSSRYPNNYSSCSVGFHVVAFWIMMPCSMVSFRETYYLPVLGWANLGGKKSGYM